MESCPSRPRVVHWVCLLGVIRLKYGKPDRSDSVNAICTLNTFCRFAKKVDAATKDTYFRHYPTIHSFPVAVTSWPITCFYLLLNLIIAEMLINQSIFPWKLRILICLQICEFPEVICPVFTYFVKEYHLFGTFLKLRNWFPQNSIG